MCGQAPEKSSDIIVEEICDFTNDQQAEMIADHYARISNQYKPLEKSDMPQEYSEPNSAPPMLLHMW